MNIYHLGTVDPIVSCTWSFSLEEKVVRFGRQWARPGWSQTGTLGGRALWREPAGAVDVGLPVASLVVSGKSCLTQGWSRPLDGADVALATDRPLFCGAGSRRAGRISIVPAAG